ncbi:MAG TPA: condensation domain-containing protein, partial [Candidatus Deferrimicrobium sp.]|nr:condensation domain-containing protein [Candidatus Deferrimicrobium sp.]
FIGENKIKTLFLPMAFLKVIFNEDDYLKAFPRCVEHIQTAGEQVVVSEKFKKYLQENHIYLHNHYGPSETHVITTFTVNPREESPEFPAIGKPIQNTGIYILDKSRQLLPIGLTGELYAEGLQVGRGYLNNPELTTERFDRDLWNKKDGQDNYGIFQANFHHSSFTGHHSKLYRTGDLARRLCDGNIEFLGRIDHQVKIRGIRIELGEIEKKLLNHPEIKEAVVLMREDNGDKYLCAYVVSNNKLSIADVREHLSMELPDYMVPGYFVQLEKIPLTPNGKIDRKTLPKPELTSPDGYTAPRNEIEKKLVEIWSDILGSGGLLGIDDNFFQLGGHSLKATILVSKIHKEFDVKIPLVEIFQSPTIKGLSGYIRTAGKVKYAAIEPIEKKEYYEMSHAQVRLWILDRMEKDLVAYNIPGYFQLEELNRRALERAVETLIKRHEILRTTFITIAGEPKQKVHEYKDLDFNIPYFDLRSAENKEVTVNSFLEAERNTPFSLETGPLLRTRLLHVEENRFFVLYTMHHIISDQWSMKIMVEEFKKLYEAYENNKERTLVPLHIQYKDYTRWHLEQLTGENLKKHQQYWHNRFNGDIPRLELPTDYPRSQLRSYAGEFILFSLSKEITGHLKRICKEFGTTLFIILLSVVKVFLYRYTGQTDIIVGTPAAGREHKDLENQIGFYVNMLPLRNQLQGHQDFAEVLQMIDDSTLESLSHQVYPFDLLVHELKLATDMSRSPLVDVVVSFDSIDNQMRYTDDPDSPGTNGRDDLFESGTEASKHDLRLRFMDLGDTVMVHIRYNPQLFKKERILVIKERLIALIKSIIAGIDQKIDDLPFISALEMEKPKNKFKGGF